MTVSLHSVVSQRTPGSSQPGSRDTWDGRPTEDLRHLADEGDVDLVGLEDLYRAE
jgi:hypothetical protein